MENFPINSLPDEVLAQIFSHLSQREILTSVLPVCRRWQAVAQSEVFRKRLAFYKNDGVPTEEALRLIERAPNLKSLQLDRRPDTVQLVQAAGSCCTKLHRLRVEVSRFEASALTAALLTVFHSCSEHLTDLTLVCGHIADGLPFCQELSTTLPNLRRLTIDCSWFGPAELDAVMDSCPQMQEIRAIRCTCSDTQIGRLVQRWGPSLQVLELSAKQLTDAGVAVLADCSQLRNLQLRQLRTHGAGLQQLASLAQLEQFSLWWCNRVQLPNIRQFINESRSAGWLRNIKIRRCNGVNNKVLYALAAACPCLEEVDVACCKRVSELGVLVLLRGCRRLLSLNVRMTDPRVGQILPQLPQLAPQLRWLAIDRKLLRSRPEVVRSVEAQMPGLEINKHIGPRWYYVWDSPFDSH